MGYAVAYLLVVACVSWGLGGCSRVSLFHSSVVVCVVLYGQMAKVHARVEAVQNARRAIERETMVRSYTATHSW